MAAARGTSKQKKQGPGAAPLLEGSSTATTGRMGSVEGDAPAPRGAGVSGPVRRGRGRGRGEGDVLLCPRRVAVVVVALLRGATLREAAICCDVHRKTATRIARQVEADDPRLFATLRSRRVFGVVSAGKGLGNGVNRRVTHAAVLRAVYLRAKVLISSDNGRWLEGHLIAWGLE